MNHPSLSLNLNINSNGVGSMDKALGTARPVRSVEAAQPPELPENQKKDHRRQSTVSQDKFADIIFDVGKRLPKSRLKDVTFLCYDKVSNERVLEDAKSATDILRDMSVLGTLDKTNVGLIAELLHRIGMVKAKREVFEGTDITWPTNQGDSYLNPFRCLLHDITQQLSKSKLSDLTNYCRIRGMILEPTVAETRDFLDFFVSLEDQEAIASDNIGLLEDFSQNIFKSKKVKDFIQHYEEETRKHGPILSLNEEESNKLLTHKVLQEEPNVSLEKYYGSYKFPTSNKRPVENMKIGQTVRETSRADSRNRPLVTPAMLSNSVTMFNAPLAGSSTMENTVTGAKAGVSSIGSSPEPMDDSQSAGPLQSTDVEPDNAGDDDDSTEWFTLQHDYHGSLKISLYPMDANPKGICFILSNERFDRQPGQKEPSDREGSEKDVKNLKRIFSNLKFEVIIERNLSAKEIRGALKELQNRDHSKYNAIVCCILSHGNRGIILGRDGKAVNLSKIIGYFKGENCPSLIGKPKIFIVQACQGERWQTVTTDQTPRSPTGDGVGMGADFATLPNEVDILVILSTIPGYLSVRSPEKGSWFIMALTHILKNHPDAEMQSVVMLVNEALAKFTKAKVNGRTIAQTALPSHTLRKLLFLERAKHQSQP